MPKKVLVGISGGVDSAVAAYLLQKDGYEVEGGFMINYKAPEGEKCTTEEDLIEAKKVCEFLNIPLHIFDYRNEYEDKILNYIFEGYKSGITPNPDVFCNKEIKFKVFLDEALALGYDFIATGHYARILHENGNYKLLKGKDNSKDQSYFLSFLDQKKLSKSLFPIGELEKKEVRKIAEEIGLPNAKRKDSQGLCFVGKVDFEEFLQKKIDIQIGDIIDKNGKIIGKHNGVFFYTIGQRKGLNIGGLKNPVFVYKKDIEKNILYVSDDENDLKYKFLEVSKIHFITSEKTSFPISGKAKIRYRQEDKDVKVSFNTEKNKYIFEFKEEQRAVTSGQIVAFYRGEELIFSGVIG